MKIYVLDKEYEFENSEKDLRDIFDTIKKESNKSGYYFAYIVVDGVDIHYNFKDFIEKNIKSIDKIRVVSMTFREMVSSSILSIREYIEEELLYIPSIAAGLKRGASEGTLKELDELLEGIGWIIEYFQRVDSTQNLNHVIADYYTWNEYALDVYRLGELIDGIEDAVAEEDDLKLARLIETDIMQIFRSMLDKLGKLCKA